MAELVLLTLKCQLGMWSSEAGESASGVVHVAIGWRPQALA